MISVIVLAHDKIELTRRCLLRLAASRGGEPLDVICVDNASTDSFEPLVAEFARGAPRVRFLRNAANLSFSTANNLAVSSAQGDKLLFLNNDVVVGPDSIAALFAPMVAHRRVGVVGARLLFPGGRRVQHAGISPMLWGFASNYAVGAACDDRRVTEPRDVFAVTGAMLGVRRDLFEQVGGFDEAFRWGYEDVDLCLKAQERGYEVRYVPDEPSLHLESATLEACRCAEEDAANYERYRSKWDHWLVDRERAYLATLRSERVHRAVVFGAGKAARGLSRMLSEAHIEVVAFTTTTDREIGTMCCGRPVVPLARVPALSFDRLLIGSQFFFEVEDIVAGVDPRHTPLFPVVG